MIQHGGIPRCQVRVGMQGKTGGTESGKGDGWWDSTMGADCAVKQGASFIPNSGDGESNRY